jgi:hypothetical protein
MMACLLTDHKAFVNQIHKSQNYEQKCYTYPVKEPAFNTEALIWLKVARLALVALDAGVSFDTLVALQAGLHWSKLFAGNKCVWENDRFGCLILSRVNVVDWEDLLKATLCFNDIAISAGHKLILALKALRGFVDLLDLPLFETVATVAELTDVLLVDPLTKLALLDLHLHLCRFS